MNPTAPATAPAVPLDPSAVAGAIAAHAAASMPKPAPAAPDPVSQPAPPSPALPATAPAGTQLTDKSGRTFDPTKHKAHADGSPFVNSAGYFMPIGGRKAKAAPAPLASPGTPAVAPAAPAPDASGAWSAADRAAASAPAPGAPNADPAAPPAGAPAAPDGRGEDAKLSPEAAGELGARALYTLAGGVFGDHRAAAPAPAEHENIVKTVSAYLRFRGWAAVGLVAIALTVVAYLIDEKRRASVGAKFRAWFASRKPEPRPVEAEPAPARSAPVEATPPAPSPAGGAPAGLGHLAHLHR